MKRDSFHPLQDEFVSTIFHALRTSLTGIRDQDKLERGRDVIDCGSGRIVSGKLRRHRDISSACGERARIEEDEGASSVRISATVPTR